MNYATRFTCPFKYFNMCSAAPTPQRQANFEYSTYNAAGAPGHNYIRFIKKRFSVPLMLRNRIKVLGYLILHEKYGYGMLRFRLHNCIDGVSALASSLFVYKSLWHNLTFTYRFNVGLNVLFDLNVSTKVTLNEI